MSVLSELKKQYQIDHIGVAVESIDSSIGFYKTLGFDSVKTEEVAQDKVRVAFIEFANQANIELIEAMSVESPIHKYLEKRGPGIHHICIRVPDIQKVIEELKKQEIKMIDQQARDGAHNCLVAFIHPKSAGGVLIELSQKKN